MKSCVVIFLTIARLALFAFIPQLEQIFLLFLPDYYIFPHVCLFVCLFCIFFASILPSPSCSCSLLFFFSTIIHYFRINGTVPLFCTVWIVILIPLVRGMGNHPALCAQNYHLKCPKCFTDYSYSLFYLSAFFLLSKKWFPIPNGSPTQSSCSFSVPCLTIQLDI